jgi:anti-sigma B factor antagonist
MATVPQVAVEIRKVDTGETQVVVLGEIDLITAPEVDRALKKLRHRIVLDLRKVEFMDSTGIRLILEHRQRLESSEGHLRILANTGPVTRLFELAGLTDVLDVSGSLHPPLSA